MSRLYVNELQGPVMYEFKKPQNREVTLGIPVKRLYYGQDIRSALVVPLPIVWDVNLNKELYDVLLLSDLKAGEAPVYRLDVLHEQTLITTIEFKENYDLGVVQKNLDGTRIEGSLVWHRFGYSADVTHFTIKTTAVVLATHQLP